MNHPALWPQVTRKLRLAAAAERAEDREAVCAEVFSDVTGLADAATQVRACTLFVRGASFSSAAPCVAECWTGAPL